MAAALAEKLSLGRQFRTRTSPDVLGVSQPTQDKDKPRLTERDRLASKFGGLTARRIAFIDRDQNKSSATKDVSSDIPATDTRKGPFPPSVEPVTSDRLIELARQGDLDAARRLIEVLFTKQTPGKHRRTEPTSEPFAGWFTESKPLRQKFANLLKWNRRASTLK